MADNLSFYQFEFERDFWEFFLLFHAVFFHFSVWKQLLKTCSQEHPTLSGKSSG
jgi:hypothetical protein